MKKIIVYMLSLAVILGNLQIGAVQVQAAPTASTKTHYANEFNAHNESEMLMADWSNGDMFNCTWTPGNISFNNGIMTMKIDKNSSGYTGGEYRTNEYFGYGMYQVCMKPIKNDGVVSSFFTYTGPSDGTTWDEIDIEFLGKDTTHVQFNYYVDGRGGHEKWYDLGFDASEEYHIYGFYWSENEITWYVDGEPVYTASSEQDKIPSHPSKIMMNVWPGINVDDWLKPYNGKTPLYAYYDWMAYDAPTGTTDPGTGSGSGSGTGTGTGDTGTGSGSSSKPESPEGLAFNSSWYKIISKNSGKAIDVDHGYTDDGANILQYSYHDAENQQWVIEKQSNGYFTIKNRKTGKVLTVQDFSTNLAGNVHQWEYLGNTNQEWSIIPAEGGYKIKNRNSGYLLTVANESKDDTANVEQYRDENGSAQIWQIECIHTKTEIRNAQKATANANGYTGDEYCLECNALLKKGDVIPKEGCLHETTEIKNAKEASCIEKGYTGDVYCKICGMLIEKGTEITKSKNHKWDNGTVKVWATAETNGIILFTCTVCRETYEMEYSIDAPIPGETEGCQHEEMKWEQVKEATCKEEGYTGDVLCAVCNKLMKKGETIPKTGNHKWSDGKVTTPAVSGEDGIITFTCTVCNEKYKVNYKAEPSQTEEDEENRKAAETVMAAIDAIGTVTLDSEAAIKAAKAAYNALTDAQKKLVTNYGILETAEKDLEKQKEDASKAEQGKDETVTQKPEETGAETKAPAAGDILTEPKTGAQYKVISVDGNAGTAEYTAPADKNVKTASVPDMVEINGVNYKVTGIAKNAFKNCKKMTRVTVGSNIQTIGASAFENCTKLKSITIGKNVKKIGKKAFYGDKKLAKITIKTTKLTSKNVGSKAFAKTNAKAKVKVPKKKLKAYKTLLVKKGISRKASIKK